MDYIITFLEGIVSFISPCMLPMLPVYISYFAGQSKDETGKSPKMIFKVIAFVVGFTVVFTALGLFSGTLGKLLSKYQTIVNIVSGQLQICADKRYTRTAGLIGIYFNIEDRIRISRPDYIYHLVDARIYQSVDTLVGLLSAVAHVSEYLRTFGLVLAV